MHPEEARGRLEHVRALIDGTEGLDKVKNRQPVRAIRYNMFGFFRQGVELYCELAKVHIKTLKKVATPSLDDHQLKPEDFEEEGYLSKDAAKITMKALYGAGLVRFELLWPICSSARNVTRWNRACDKRLHRLMCYINQTEDHSLESFVGDPPELCHPVLFSDADFCIRSTDCKVNKWSVSVHLRSKHIRSHNCYVQKADVRLAFLHRERDRGSRARNPH